MLAYIFKEKYIRNNLPVLITFIYEKNLSLNFCFVSGWATDLPKLL